MLELSHQMMPQPRIVPLALLLSLGSLAGCAIVGPEGPAWTGPAYFPDAHSVPRIVVHGDMLSRLPRTETVSALEVFLYGPPEVAQSALRNPQGMALQGDQLLICDQGQLDVLAIDLSTGQSRYFCDPNHPPRCPVDVAVDARGNVYVADTTRRSVLIYSSEGQYRGQVVTTADPDRSFRPAAVTVHDQVLFIGNIGEHRIDRWSLSENRWLSPWAPPAGAKPLYAPSGLCVGPRGVLYVADSVQGVIFRVDPQGQWLSPVGSPGRMAGQLVRPKHVACTASGLVLVTDAGRQSLLVFDADGRFLVEVHEGPADWPGWVLPAGVMVLPGGGQTFADGFDGHGERVVVSDALGRVSLSLLTAVTRADMISSSAEGSK
ncbi:MAG: NHL repeat-containing protein [Phycisphaerae bacterium]